MAKASVAVDVLDTVRSLREEFLEPTASNIDAERQTYPYEQIDALRKAGLLAVGVPKEYGGLGTATELRVNQLYREIAKACSSTAQVFFVHVVDVDAAFKGPNEGLKQFLAQEILEKGTAVAVAASELGRTAAEIKAPAERVEGGYILNGLKGFCTGHEGAEYMSTVAMLKDAPSPREAGMTCLLSMRQSGVQVNHDWNNMGQRSTSSGSVNLENVFVPDSMVVSPPGYPLPILHLRVLQSAFSSIYLGIAEGALEKAVQYIQTKTRPRVGFAETAVDDPLIQWHIGDLSTQIEATSLMLDNVDDLLVREARGEVSAHEALVAVCKLKISATRTALEVTNRIFQLMGARSSACEYNFDRYWRDARTLTLHDPVDTRLQQVGRYILKGERPLELWEYSADLSTRGL